MKNQDTDHDTVPNLTFDDLTFNELRLATWLHGGGSRAELGLARILAEIVILADEIAAANNIDLATALRDRFAEKSAE